MHWLVRFQVLILVTVAVRVNAQLAITEIMPYSKPNMNSGFHGAEYWELTNFGTNDLNLDGYAFRDSNPNPRHLNTNVFTNLVIRAGESVIFFRIETDDQSVTTTAHFRAWWGDSKLPPDLQCRIYTNLGLTGVDSDAVWVFDPAGRAVDWVEFSEAQAGRSLTYDPATGLFGTFSSAGVDGAFAADLADDMGSPGSTAGPVPVRFLQQPAGRTADVGMTVTLAVAASGLPRPRYQWFANGLSIPNAMAATLVLSNLQASNGGDYHVVITNGVTAATSVVATLTINTNPTPAGIITAPLDASIFTRQTAVFTVSARGVPPPTYRWQTNGVDIPGATGPTLQIPNATLAMSGIRCSVIVSNAFGSATASGLLTVTYRPNLRITEVFASPLNADQNRHLGWFELTNYDTNAVDLFGWRFAEEYSFEFAFTITNALALEPGESVVFAQRLNRDRFAAWWGPANLPSPFKLYTFRGFGLNRTGELYLWNPAALNPYFDVVTSVLWPSSTDGISFECTNFCDPDNGCIADANIKSVVGLRGAFRAVDDDIGSPGYVANPALQILSVDNPGPNQIQMTCKVTPNRRYQLRRASSLASSTWERLQIQAAANNVITIMDQVPQTERTWFYRIEQLP